MSLLQTYLWAEIDDETARKIVTGITRVFIDLGIPAEALRVIIHEVPKSPWGIAGHLALKKFSLENKL